MKHEEKLRVDKTLKCKKCSYLEIFKVRKQTKKIEAFKNLLRSLVSSGFPRFLSAPRSSVTTLKKRVPAQHLKSRHEAIQTLAV